MNKLRHGTSTLYTYGCRCSACKGAHAARMRAYYAHKKEEKKRAEREALLAEIRQQKETGDK